MIAFVIGFIIGFIIGALRALRYPKKARDWAIKVQRYLIELLDKAKELLIG